MPSSLPLIIGIDFGSRYAGTTVIAVASTRRGKITNVELISTRRGEDSDHVILSSVRNIVSNVNPTKITVGIDAPLSLPMATRKVRPAPESDFLFRKCDRELEAMSPLFLGGLTGRAMKLAATLQAMFGAEILEVYPAALADTLTIRGYREGKRGKIIPNDVREAIHHLLPLAPTPQSYHELDALLALLSVLRFLNKTAKRFGSRREGMITV